MGLSFHIRSYIHFPSFSLPTCQDLSHIFKRLLPITVKYYPLHMSQSCSWGGGRELLCPVEASTTKGTTALVYCLTNSSLYTGTVHRWWSTFNWPDGHQGCRQVSTGLPLSTGLGWEEKRSEVQRLWRCSLTGWVPRLWHL